MKTRLIQDKGPAAGLRVEVCEDLQATSVPRQVLQYPQPVDAGDWDGKVRFALRQTQSGPVAYDPTGIARLGRRQRAKESLCCENRNLVHQCHSWQVGMHFGKPFQPANRQFNLPSTIVSLSR